MYGYVIKNGAEETAYFFEDYNPDMHKYCEWETWCGDNHLCYCFGNVKPPEDVVGIPIQTDFDGLFKTASNQNQRGKFPV